MCSRLRDADLWLVSGRLISTFTNSSKQPSHPWKLGLPIHLGYITAEAVFNANEWSCSLCSSRSKHKHSHFYYHLVFTRESHLITVSGSVVQCLNNIQYLVTRTKTRAAHHIQCKKPILQRIKTLFDVHITRHAMQLRLQGPGISPLSVHVSIVLILSHALPSTPPKILPSDPNNHT